MMRIIKSLLCSSKTFLSIIGLISIVVSGCASSSSIEIKQTMKAEKGKYDTVVVSFISMAKDSDGKSIEDQLVGSVVSNLREKNYFKKVYSKSATLEKKFDLIVEVSPVEANDIDVAHNILVWAGRSNIKAKVDLIDGGTGEKLGSSIVRGKAAFKATIFNSSSMAQAIERVGEKIADYIVENN